MSRFSLSLCLSAILLVPLLPSHAEQVVFSEVMYHPSGSDPEYIEIHNNTATPLDIARWRLRGGVDYDFPDFSASDPQASFLKPFERIILSGANEATLRSAYSVPEGVRCFGPWTGNLNNGGERVTLKDKNGIVVCTVRFNDRGRWSPAADGAGHSLVLIDPNTKIDDWRNWTVSLRPMGTPGTESVIETEAPMGNPEIDLSQGIPFVDYADVWTYLDDGSDQGTAWRQSVFNDSSWPSGQGLFGQESSSIPQPIRTATPAPGSGGPTTIYYRTRFDYSGPLTGVNISVDLILDDGVVIWLNGTELGRVGVPGGEPNYDTFANRTVGNAAEELNAILAGGSALINGENVLCAEVHQHSLTSSDTVFGARLKISSPTRPSLVINEIFPGSAGNGFIEIYNPGSSTINLRDHYLTDNPGDLTRYQIATDILLPPAGLASVGFTESGFTYADPSVVYLTEPDGLTTINAVSASIPADGRSAGRKPTGSNNWFLFADPTRNAPNASQSTLAAMVRPNEVHFALGTKVDWVELYNSSESSIGLDGLFLASKTDFSDKVALTGSISAGGYVSQDVDFPVSNGQLTLFLINSSDSVLNAQALEKTGLGDSLQAYPDGVEEWYGAAGSTRDLPNAPSRNTDVVFHEIMYDPPSDEEAGEFIELHNRGSQEVDLSGWRINEGVSFTFPQGTRMAPASYLVVAADADWMTTAYGAIDVVGNWDGRLSNNGDLVRLVDAWGGLVDEVDYKAGGDWPNLAKGDGSSMELRHPAMDNSLPSAWRDSHEINKASFQTFRYTDTFRQLRADGGATDHKELHIHLVGDSHVVLRNIQLRQNGAGNNLLVNANQISPSGDSSLGWVAQGTHYSTHFENSDLHIISDGHGDNRPNRVEIDAIAMNSGTSYEVSFDARWAGGSSRMVVQTWDHSIATSIPLPVPNNLGTPGFPNSQRIDTPAPQVDKLRHSPPVPSPGEIVKVTARITTASGAPVPEVRLHHRLDNNNGDGTWISKLMYDDGFSGGDDVTGDGIYTAELTEYGNNGQVVEFYVQAESNGRMHRMPKWGTERPALYVVDTPSSIGDLKRFRFVVSAFDLRTLSDQDNPTGSRGNKFPRLSNHYFNMTLIANEQDIIYNCEARVSGSPWTRGGSLSSRGKFKIPRDKLYRNHEKYSYDNDAGGGSRHHNRIVRYWLYLLGHPGNENEYFQLEVNNGGSNLREEVEAFGNDILDRIYPDGSQGELYRIDDEWWFTDSWGRSSRNADWSYKGSNNPGRYRTEWIKRTRENDDDFSSLISMFRKVNQSYTQQEIGRILDAEAIMKMSAVRGYIHDWDSFSLNRGKNGYLYRRNTDGRFMFWHWDSDLAFRSGDLGASFYNGMAGFRPYIQKSYSQRLFKHYLSLVVEDYSLGSDRMNAWLQAEEDASSQYTVSSTYANTWFPGRDGPARSFIGSSLNTLFNITSNSGNPISTSAATVDLTGTAPIRVFEVEVLDHPEALFTWTTDTAWRLDDILLHTGVNLLTIQGVDDQGQVLFQDFITVNKSGNAAPVMDLDADPKSWHVSVIDTLEVKANDSYDPDGDPLTYAWSVNPPDVQLDFNEAGDKVDALFPRPGLYSFSVAGQDGDGTTRSVTREAAVYAPDGFSSFNDTLLEPYWNVENVERRPNTLISSYYSSTEESGQLILNILDDQARPIQGGYPLVWRALPESTDWTFITKVGLRGLIFGNYTTGLLVELNEGSNVRYAFGIDDGDKLTVKRINAAGNVSLLRSASLTENEVEIRVRRAGNVLYFEQASDKVWAAFHNLGLPFGTVGQKAGLFLSSDSAQNLKSAFDFALLVDPSATSDLRQSLRISEIMYNPVGGTDFEFVELVNIGDTTLDLSNVRFVSGIDYTFGSLLLAPQQYLMVVKNQAAFASRYSLSGLTLAPGNYAGRLSDDSDTLELADADGSVFLSITYSDSGSWPAAADGKGNSLEVIDPSGNLDEAANWRASPEPNGSPGRSGGDALGTVIINETLTHSDFPVEDAIELHNRTGQAMDVGGWFLSDSKSEPKRFRIPDVTVIPALGYAVFYEVDFNTNNTLVPFSLSSAKGDQIYLSAADGAGNLTGYQQAVEFDAAENGVSFGRYVTSVGEAFTAMETLTLGANNPVDLADFRTGTGAGNGIPLIGPAVINEIMYHPMDIGGTNDNAMDEFIEIHNLGLTALDLFDPAFPSNTWRLRGGSDFDFPMGVTLPARGYLLVTGFDPSTNAVQTAAFRATYGLPGAVPVLGPYDGKLGNGGDIVKLTRPDTPQGPGPDEGVVPYILVDLVQYGDAAPWPETADGMGDSNQRRRPFDYGDDPVNWKGQLPTPGRANVPGAGFEDTDGDGLPDGYEIAAGLNAGDAEDEGLDRDLDGKTEYEEFLDGTDPMNTADRLTAPVLAQQPIDLSRSTGDSAVFTVVAAGSGPLRYQWKFNGSAIGGATNDTLALAGVGPASQGEYNVTVSNPAGFIISDQAYLTVVQPLQILTQPLSQVTDIGANVTFSVFAVGTGDLSYQWQFNGANIAGATDDSLILNDLQPEDSGNYVVLVADDGGFLESAQANLEVLSPPLILEHPQSQTVVAYSDSFLSVTAGGQGPFTYQWRFNGVNIQGATNAFLPLPNIQLDQEGVYSVEVFNPVSSTITDDAVITLLIPATILQQPTSQFVDPGGSATLTVVASSSTPMTYQWRFNDIEIPGATSASLDLVNLGNLDSGNYQVFITDGVGTIGSEIALVVVLTQPRVVIPPITQSVVEGGSVTFSLLADGAIPMGYRWRKGGLTVTNMVISSRETFYTIKNVTLNDAGSYTVVLTNAAFYQPGILSPRADLFVLPDTDGDLMPDEWETLNGLNPADAGDAGLDLDEDGLTSVQEYEAGTDPGLAESLLKIETLEMANGSGSVLSFASVSNLTYTVEYTDFPGSGFWEKLDDVVAMGTNGVQTVGDPDSRSSRYYRLITPKQPATD